MTPNPTPQDQVQRPDKYRLAIEFRQHILDELLGWDWFSQVWAARNEEVKDEIKANIGGLTVEVIDEATAALTAETERLRAENERLNKWADGFDDAARKERLTGEQYIKELRACIQQLEAALEPFAKAARHEIEADALMSPEFRHGDYDNEYIVIQFGDLRRAASAQAIREEGEK